MTDKPQQRERFDAVWYDWMAKEYCRIPTVDETEAAFEGWQAALSQPAVAGAVDEEIAQAKVICHWFRHRPGAAMGDPSECGCTDKCKGKRPIYNYVQLVKRINDLRTASPSQPAAEDETLTDELVTRFAVALKVKLNAATEKYGYSDGWKNDNWRDDLIDKLLDHVRKGDPRDVAAYCAFAWHHGWSVTPPTEPGRVSLMRMSSRSAKTAEQYIRELEAKLRASPADDDNLASEMEECLLIFQRAFQDDGSNTFDDPSEIATLRHRSRAALRKWADRSFRQQDKQS